MAWWNLVPFPALIAPTGNARRNQLCAWLLSRSLFGLFQIEGKGIKVLKIKSNYDFCSKFGMVMEASWKQHGQELTNTALPVYYN